MHADLTPQEQLLLDMNKRGCSQKRIAAEIGCGVRKVRNMVGRLRKRGHQVVCQRADRPERPYQIAEMLTAGMTCKEVAVKLRLSPATVRDLQRKALKMGLAVPLPIEREAYEQSLEKVCRDIRKIEAPAIQFKGNVFEDVKFKSR